MDFRITEKEYTDFYLDYYTKYREENKDFRLGQAFFYHFKDMYPQVNSISNPTLFYEKDDAVALNYIIDNYVIVDEPNTSTQSQKSVTETDKQFERLVK